MAKKKVGSNPSSGNYYCLIVYQLDHSTISLCQSQSGNSLERLQNPPPETKRNMIFQKITHFRQSSILFCNSELSLYAEKNCISVFHRQIYCRMRNCFPAFIFSVIQATSKSDGKLVFLHYNFRKASWNLQLSGAPTVVERTSSCPGYLQLSKAPTVVQSMYNYRTSLQLSGLPTAVESIFSCREHL